MILFGINNYRISTAIQTGTIIPPENPPVDPPIDPPADTDIYALLVDPVSDRYIFDGTEYDDQAQFLSDAGGTVSNGEFTFQDYISPTAPNWVVNGNFDANVDGWEKSQATAILSWVSGRAELDLNGQNYSALRQSVPVERSKAYRAQADVEVTNAGVRPNFQFGDAQTGLLSGTSTQALNATKLSDSDTLRVQIYHNIGGGATTISYLDNVSVYEVNPFKGYVPGEISGEISGTIPADTSGTQNLIFFHTDEANDTQDPYLRIAISSGNLILTRAEKRNGTTLVVDSFTLKTGVTPGEPFTLHFAVTNSYLATKYNSDDPIITNVGTLSGFARMFLNRSSSSGYEFGNTTSVFKIYKVFTTPPGVSLEFMAHHGDSYGGIKSQIAAGQNAVVLSTNIGGSELPDAVDRAVNAASNYSGYVNTFWDGAANGFTNITDWMAEYQRLLDAYGSNIIVLPPIDRPSLSSGESADAQAIQAALATMFGDNYIDAQSILETEYPNLSDAFSDGTHLTEAAYQAVYDDGLGARIDAVQAAL